MAQPITRPSCRRADPRVACHVPVRLFGPAGWLDATIVDLSRSGARIGIPLGSLGFAPEAPFGEIAEHLPDRLPRHAAVELDPARLGSLIARRATLVRVATEAEAPATVEVGCAFDRPLDEMETSLLGVVLPAQDEPQDAAPWREGPGGRDR